MNLLEAIKSGRRFYRAGWNSRESIDISGLGNLPRGALLATDWKVEDKKTVTIDSSDFDWAVLAIGFEGKQQTPSEEYLLELKRRLGL